MTDENLSSNFPRDQLTRRLSPRPQVKVIYLSGLIVGVFSTAVCMSLSWLVFSISGWEQTFLSSLLIYWLPVGIFYYSLKVLRPPISNFVEVSPAGLIYHLAGTVHELNYQDIKKLVLSPAPLLNGWFELTMNDDKKYRFTVGLERSEYILEMIQARRPELANVEVLLNYRKMAILVDHSSARLVQSFKDWKQYLLVLGLMILSTFSLGRAFPGESLLMATTSGFLWTSFVIFASYFLKELVLITVQSKRLDKDPMSVVRNVKFDAMASWIGWACCFLFVSLLNWL